MKILNACGEAGAVLTNDDAVRERAVALRYNGCDADGISNVVSLNGRIDTMQAAILNRRLDRLEDIIARRREIARRYNEAFARMVAVPREASGCRDVFYTYTIRSERRDALRSFIEARGIEARIQHPVLVSDHPAHRNPGSTGGAYPVGQRAVARVLCLPGHENLDDDQIGHVIDSVSAFFRQER
jgi:dTDP-4-amino-4,6-dideoxygalactose transaminase